MRTLPAPTVPGKKCTDCGTHKPLTEFYHCNNRRHRVNCCRECVRSRERAYRSCPPIQMKSSAYQHAYYLRNIGKFQSKRDRRKAELLAYVTEIKRSRGCAVCPEREPVCLSFHHTDPGAKSKTVGWLVNRGMAQSLIDAEIAKCIIVCENCHRKIHAGIITLPAKK